MPADLCGGQRVIIQVLTLGDLSLQRDISADEVSAAIEEQRGEQPAHSAVAVGERVNTQKIVNEHGDENERIDLSLRDSEIKLLAYRVNGDWRFIGGKRRENGIFLSVGADRIDIILHVFKFAADAFAGMTVKNFMQLQDIIRRDRDKFVAFVNDVESIPVAGNFLLVACARGGLIGQKLFKPCIRRADTINLVRGFGALNPGDLHKFIKFLRLLLKIELLPAFRLMD